MFSIIMEIVRELPLTHKNTVQCAPQIYLDKKKPNEHIICMIRRNRLGGMQYQKKANNILIL